MVNITAGMIGVGKTTLTSLIAKHMNTKAFYDPVGEIPFYRFITLIQSNMVSCCKYTF